MDNEEFIFKTSTELKPSYISKVHTNETTHQLSYRVLKCDQIQQICKTGVIGEISVDDLGRVKWQTQFTPEGYSPELSEYQNTVKADLLEFLFPQ